ncbi:MAG: aminotransferase class I/II-fold pyridoxal phosphate-dependent enzyme [Phycisphaerae bacterium]|nr:aminotransferase class I/II-fold pyridoxal phosphate-dependent enzyme [Phycisphaerae bacterium]
MIARKKNTPEVHLNLNVRGLSQSATLSINEHSASLRREGRQIFRLGLGQSPFPVPAPVVEALKVNAHQKDYLPVKGLSQLRQAVADYHRQAQGIDCSADDVLIGPGSKELMFLVQLVYYGDLVIPVPSWVSYAPQAHIIGRHVHWLPTQSANDWRLTPDELQRLCRSDPDRPRILILNYPANPTGMTYRATELKAIAQVARKHRVILISDEIYGELHYKGQHVSIARFYPEGTIISGGLSKWCGAGGWRLGTFVFPHALRWLLDAMAVVASETFTSTSAPIQYAAVRAFRGGIEIQNYLWSVRRVLGALGRHVATRLRKTGAQVATPEGAFYLFPDFSPLRKDLAKRGIETSRQLCDRLLEETGVAVLPGSDFGVADEVLAARLACVDFDGARVLAAVEQLPRTKAVGEAFLRDYCGNVTTAIDRLADWLRTKSTH